MSPSESLDRFFVSEISLSEANSVESTRAGVHLKRSLILNSFPLSPHGSSGNRTGNVWDLVATGERWRGGGNLGHCQENVQSVFGSFVLRIRSLVSFALAEVLCHRLWGSLSLSLFFFQGLWSCGPSASSALRSFCGMIYFQYNPLLS